MIPLKPDWDDYDVLASRATEPTFYRAPYPENSKHQPKEYQHAGVEYQLARNNGIFGDAPGLGKTGECILLSNAIGSKSNLVICPASLRLNWEREIWTWSTIPNVTTYPIMKSKDGVSDKADWVIMSFDLLRHPAILNALMDLRWDHIMVDEAHKNIKDPKGNVTALAITREDLLRSVCGRMTFATGTLLPNQPRECYNAVRTLCWDAIDRASLDEFVRYYYDEGEGFVTVKGERKWSKHVRNVAKNLDDLQWRLRKHLMIRRLKEQVLHELPPKQWHPFPLAITPAMKAALKHPGWREAEKLYELDPDAFDHAVPIDGAIATARRLLGEAKAPSVAEYIIQLLEEGVQKIVVGAWNKTTLAILRAALEKYGLVYMDGATSSGRKQEAVDRFQSDDRVRIILGQMIPLGMGWTLTAAQDVVLAEFDWVPGNNDQFLDRIHRMGQTGSHVIGHVPVVPGTLDERILGSAIAKDQTIYSALDEDHR